MNIGGQEFQLLQQMTELQQRGWRTRLVCKPNSRISHHALALGLEVVTARFRNAVHLPSILTVRRQLIELNASAVIVHSGHDANIGGTRQPLMRTKTAYHYPHENLSKRLAPSLSLSIFI